MLATGDAQAQTGWPAGPIKLIVAYPPGGSTDVIARLIQPCLQERLATTIIVENRSGASGSVATAAVVRSAPDGSNWLMVFDNHAANPFVLSDLPYDTEKDLDPVLLIGIAPYVLSTQTQKPFKTLSDVIASAKAKPDTISYASVGSGSVGHLAMAQLRRSRHRQHRAFHSANPGRHSSGRRSNRQNAHADPWRRADYRRERFSRFRGVCLVGRVCAGPHGGDCG